MLPPLMRGEDAACFAVTEPDTGLNTTPLKTTRRAARRALPRLRAEDLDLDRAGREQGSAAGARPRRGSRSSTPTSTARHVEVREIEKMGRKAVDSNQLFIDALRGAGEGSHRRGRQRLRVHPPRLQPRAHPHRRRAGGLGRAAREPRAPRTPRNGSCSTGRSGRTRRSSTRSPRTGWRWRRRTSWCSRPLRSTTPASPAARRRTPRNTSPARRASTPASRR